MRNPGSPRARAGLGGQLRERGSEGVGLPQAPRCLTDALGAWTAPEEHHGLRGPRLQEAGLRLAPYVDFGAAAEPVTPEDG